MNQNSLIEDTLVNKQIGALNRKERDRELRKSDIMSAALKVFAEKGYHEATIQDIASQAQYAVGTVYLYFKDKEALYLSLLEERTEGLTALLRESASHVADAEDKIRIFVKESLNSFERNQDFFRVFFSEKNMGHMIRKGRIIKSRIMRGHKEFIDEMIKLAQKQRVVRNDYSPKQIAETLHAIFMSVVFAWVRDAHKESKLSEKSDFVIDMFLNGAGRKR